VRLKRKPDGWRLHVVSRGKATNFMSECSLLFIAADVLDYAVAEHDVELIVSVIQGRRVTGDEVEPVMARSRRPDIDARHIDDGDLERRFYVFPDVTGSAEVNDAFTAPQAKNGELLHSPTTERWLEEIQNVPVIPGTQLSKHRPLLSRSRRATKMSQSSK